MAKNSQNMRKLHLGFKGFVLTVSLIAFSLFICNGSMKYKESPTWQYWILTIFSLRTYNMFIEMNLFAEAKSRQKSDLTP